MSDTERLRELAEKARPGPWHAKYRGIGWSVHTSEEPADGEHWNPGCPDLMDDDMLGKGVFSEPMARYLAAASPTAILALLDRLRDLETALAKYGAHWGTCGYVDGLGCTCGFRAALRGASDSGEARDGG